MPGHGGFGANPRMGCQQVTWYYMIFNICKRKQRRHMHFYCGIKILKHRVLLIETIAHLLITSLDQIIKLYALT